MIQKYVKYLCFIGIFVIISCDKLNKTGPDETRGIFLKKIFKSEQGGSIPYRFYIPEHFNRSDNYPLLIHLHGAGELGTDNERHMINFPQNILSPENSRKHPCYFLVPQCPATDAWARFPGYPGNTKTTKKPTNAMRLAIELIEQVVKNYNIDTKRIYVTGISLGGEGTFDIISRRPGFFAAAVPICGIADTTRVLHIKDIPLWIFHGDNDTVIPVTCSRSIVKALRQNGAEPKYTEYKNTGHNCWFKAYREPGFVSWIFKQKK